MGSVRPDGGGEAGNHLGEEGEARFFSDSRGFWDFFPDSRGIPCGISTQLEGSK